MNSKNKLVIIKSDTGTGKTTIITEFSKLNPDLNFLSITSRVALSIEHHRIFNNKNLKSQHYKSDFVDDDKGLCVQLESMHKIFNTYNQKKIPNSILISDEIKSFVQQFITSPTVKDKILTMMKIFLLIKEVKYIVAVDASIDESVFNFFESFNEYLEQNNEEKIKISTIKNNF